VRQIFPVTGQELEVVPAAGGGPMPQSIRQLAALYGNEAGPATTADRPWLRANMISSVDGASALSGRSGGLGGPADRMVFTVLRSLADVILVGAGTARAEHYGPVAPGGVWAGLRTGKPPTPAIAVVSNSLDLGACSRLMTVAPETARTIVFTTASAPARRVAALSDHARVVVAGQHRVDASAAVTTLRRMGHRQVLVEGGPHLLRELADAGLLDELCLTTSPVLAGGDAGRIVAAAAAGPGGRPPVPPAMESSTALPAGLNLVHVLADGGFLLARYVRSAG
jgi:riboflavin biosynthesis pyrimidine reductase